MQNENINVLLQQAIQQVKNGQKQVSAHNLALVLRADPDQVDAWLWLSACVDTREKQVYCLEQVLRIDPNHPAARKGLEELTGKAETQPIPVTGAMVFDWPQEKERTQPVNTNPPSLFAREGGEMYPPDAVVEDTNRQNAAIPFPITEGEEPVYEVHAESPVEAAQEPGRAVWIVLGLLLLAVIGLYWVTQRNSAGGDGRPFGVPAGPFASANVRIRPGDDLAAAIRTAPEGGEVFLQAGTYDLDATMEITRGVRLRGAGMNATRIHSSAPGAALRVLTNGSVQLTDLEVLHTGTDPANTVEVMSGKLTASGVRIGGARMDGQQSEGGRGLLSAHDSTVDVRTSEMVDNDLAGVEIRSPGRVSLQQNAVHDNGQYGILVGSNAAPNIQENEVNGNHTAGIVVQDGAKGELRGNVMEQNGQSGLRVDGQAAPLVYANTSQGNVQFGIEVRGQAAPILINNIAQRNGKAGLAYFDRAAGAAESNDCSANELHGISVNENASPFLKENRCNQNRQVGIDYWGNSGGTASNNQCSENGLQGIAVHENAAPVLQNNACKKNSDSGIIYWDNTAGTASNNDCSENQINGISVHDQASPLLLKNICQQNKKNGIVFYDQARGEARENDCQKNGTDTIIRPDGTGVIIQGNRCGTP